MSITTFNTIFSLLLVSILFTSCNGQTKSKRKNETVVEQQSFTSKNPKLTKTQGTDQYQQVGCSLKDKSGNIWFGTTGEGVYRYDGKVFTQFTQKDGLCGNGIFFMIEDISGDIWFGSKRQYPVSMGRNLQTYLSPTLFQAVFCIIILLIITLQ